MSSKSKTTRFLVISLVVVMLLCACVFSFLAVYMGNQSASTINEVGTLYMSNMSRQISLHFATTMDLRLEQLDALVETIIPDRIHEEPEIQKRLIETAQALEFDYLSFYTEDGTFEMLYGSPLQVTDPEPFLDSLKRKEKKIYIGSDAEGNSVVLLGVPSAHDPSEAHPCIALVAGLPVSYISETLALNETGDDFYTFIIRQDGSYVIRGSDSLQDNYFDRVRELYGEVGGRTPEEYIADLEKAMDRKGEYSSEFAIYGDRRHLYCVHLEYSEWYLLTFMSYGTMDGIVQHFSRQWARMALGAALVIIAVLLFIFARYFRLTREHLQALKSASQAAEEARAVAERASRAKSEFLSNMSHDIRTPMNAIVGMTAIAVANLDDRDQISNCLKKISLSSKHLLGLINDVLDMSKIESGKMTLNLDQVSLREVMDGIVSIVQPQIRAKGQQFNLLIHDIYAENVLCDSVRLNQVLLNLLSNAIKFTQEGGVIQMALCEEESPKGEDFVRIRVQVKDNGIGMSEEFQKHVFDSFVWEDNARVHRTEGTGLGMAITKYIVDAMGGVIEMQSALGEGTEFQVILDMQKATVQEADMVLPSWNMLVVDDDQQVCESSVAALKSIGINAEWTLDGESAVSMVVQRHERHDDYQVILLDWKLPDIDGLETARRIRRHLGDDVPILLISAYDWGEIEDEAKQAGISGFISKPLFKSTLYNGLRKYMCPEDSAPDQVEQAVDLNGRRVLLAEDNELNWEIASELLSELGLELEWAMNGQICVEKFQASQPGQYDVVLMDLRMPVMNGYEATRAIRSSGREDADIPIIAMTADAFAEDAKRCLEAGMNAHVSKPIDVHEVALLLEKYLRS